MRTSILRQDRSKRSKKQRSILFRLNSSELLCLQGSRRMQSSIQGPPVSLFSIANNSKALFLAGGIHHKKSIRSVQQYNKPEAIDGSHFRVLRLSSLAQGVYNHSACCREKELIVSGGVEFRKESGKIASLDLCRQRWKGLGLLVKARRSHSSCIFNASQLYFFGGYQAVLTEITSVQVLSYGAHHCIFVAQQTNIEDLGSACQLSSSSIIIFAPSYTWTLDCSVPNLTRKKNQLQPMAYLGVPWKPRGTDIVIIDLKMRPLLYNHRKWKHLEQFQQ